MNKFLTNLGQEFTEAEKTIIKNKIENILGTDQVKMAWYPTVANNGTISWGLSAYSTSTPTPMNIKGPQGEPGDNGVDGEPGTSVTITNIEEEGRTHVVTFSDGKSITITDGVDGAGVAIKGTVATKANLPTDAENGDAYIVTAEDGKLFVYANGWPDEGVAFTGPKGERGETPSFSFIDSETGIEIHVNDSEDPVAVIPYATDGHSPVITTSATSTGNDIYIDGTKAFSVTNGINGTSGKDGYTPSATTATVTDEGHPNSGTEITFSWPADVTWKNPITITAWNGNDGMAGDLPAVPTSAGKYVLNKPTEGNATWVDYEADAYTLTGDGKFISVTENAGTVTVGLTTTDITGDNPYVMTTAGWTNGAQYYAHVKTVGDIDSVASAINIITHNNSTGSNYNKISGYGYNSSKQQTTFEAFLLPNHWTRMFSSGANATAYAGTFVKVTPGAASNNAWYDIEPNITASETAGKKFAWDPTNNTWTAISEGGGDYLPLTGGTVSGDFKTTKNNCTTFINIDDSNHASLEFTNAENAKHRFVFGPGTNPYLYTSVSNQNQYFVMSLTSTAGNVEKLQIHSNTEDPTTFADNVIHFVLE